MTIAPGESEQCFAGSLKIEKVLRWFHKWFNGVRAVGLTGLSRLTRRNAHWPRITRIETDQDLKRQEKLDDPAAQSKVSRCLTFRRGPVFHVAIAVLRVVIRIVKRCIVEHLENVKGTRFQSHKASIA